MLMTFVIFLRSFKVKRTDFWGIFVLENSLKLPHKKYQVRRISSLRNLRKKVSNEPSLSKTYQSSVSYIVSWCYI